MMTVQEVTNVILAAETAVLVIVTGYYAYQTRCLASLTREILQAELDRWLQEVRPCLDVRFAGWLESSRGCEFEVINVGKWAALRVQFDGTDLMWVNRAAQLQGSTVVRSDGPPAIFRIPRYEKPKSGGSIEFRIRYEDVGGTREFAEKWHFESAPETVVLKVNSTVVAKQPLKPEEFLLRQKVLPRG